MSEKEREKERERERERERVRESENLPKSKRRLIDFGKQLEPHQV